MKVLIACEESQVVVEQFLLRGYDAISCDIDYPGAKGLSHYQGDVLDILYEGFDVMIAFPPCTRLSNSGVRWLHERDLWAEMREGVEFFNTLLNAPIKYKAVENPIQHGHARKLIRKYDQIIHPWQFGHTEQKSTCIWLENLPKLNETNNVYDEMMKIDYKDRAKVHYCSPGPEREKLRNRTYQGIAEAMGKQWCDYLENH